MVTTLIFTVIGSLLWRFRLGKLAEEAEKHIARLENLPTVSIIIPARNEAHNLPTLLNSLQALDYKPLEIIVVDDHSSDQTSDVAKAFNAKVVTPAMLPDGWIGKPWACHTGAQAARGEYLLFTDADTIHSPESLSTTLSSMLHLNGSLASVVPRHRAKSLWEKMQAPFHLLLYIATKAGFAALPKATERRFAIGQYLLFKRDDYEALGGHSFVKTRVAEDLAFQKAICDQGNIYVLCAQKSLLEVRMYPEGFIAFTQGWRRNFREGIRSAGGTGVLEIIVVFGWLLGLPLALFESLYTGQTTLALVWAAAYLHAMTLVGRYQKLVGTFPWWGVLATPLMLITFAITTLLAIWDELTKAPVKWRGRSIQTPLLVKRK